MNIMAGDGSGSEDPGEGDESDTIPPTVTVIGEKITSNSIAVSVSATDGESGMASSLTYTYYIKQTIEADNAYVAKATGITESTYTFIELTQGTSYDIKVEVTGDNAGNTGIGTLKNQVTEMIPGGNDAIVSGAIKFGTPTWSGGKASVTVSTNTGYQIEYQVGGTTGEWIDIANNGTISGISNGTTVYARLTDGVNVGDHASVTISDTTGPTVSLSTSATYNSITVTVNATDSGIGLATTDTYKYYIDNVLEETTESNTYTFTGLSAETRYNIKVEVADKLNNIGTGSTRIYTPKIPASNINEVEERDYIQYIDKNGKEWLCAVLYDSSSPYGVQIITMDIVEELALGYEDTTVSGSDEFTKSMNSYNSAIRTLNNAASKYLNTSYATSARSVGSVPNNPNSEASDYFYINSFSSFNNMLKNGDTNYEIDYEQMDSLNLEDIGERYWLASREAGGGPIYYFSIQCVEFRGTEAKKLCGVVSHYDSGTGYSYDYIGLRPVFTLRSGLRITGGSGTEDNPYTLN